MNLTLPTGTGSLVILLVRAVLAMAFLLESQLKLGGIRKFAKTDGLPVPLAWFVALAELAATLSFLSGVLIQLAAAGVMLLMLSTMSLHIFKWHSPYKAGRGGWEYDLLLFTLASVLLAFGGSSSFRL